MTSAGGKKPTRREVAEVVKDAIIETWDRANLISGRTKGIIRTSLANTGLFVTSKA